MKQSQDTERQYEKHQKQEKTPPKFPYWQFRVARPCDTPQQPRYTGY